MHDKIKTVYKDSFYRINEKPNLIKMVTSDCQAKLIS